METWRFFRVYDGKLISPLRSSGLNGPTFNLFGENYYKDFSPNSREIGTPLKAHPGVITKDHRKIILRNYVGKSRAVYLKPNWANTQGNTVLAVPKSKLSANVQPCVGDGFWSLKDKALNEPYLRHFGFVSTGEYSRIHVIAKIRVFGTVIEHDNGHVQSEYLEILSLYSMANAQTRRRIARQIGWPFGVLPYQRNKRGNGAKS